MIVHFKISQTMKRDIRKIRVYLDTSVISALFDEKSPEMMYWTQEFCKSKKDFNIFISDVVLTEIQETPDSQLRRNMSKEIEGMNVLEIDEKAEWLSNEYVRYGAIPGKYRRDAFHIGIATIHQIEVLLSWNYRHIVRRKTREIVRMVNALNGYAILDIMSPPEILRGEET